MIKRCNFNTNCICSYVQWTGDNENEIINFCGDKANVTHQYVIDNPSLYLVTDIGIIHVEKNNYVVKINNNICCFTEDMFNMIFESI